MSSLLGTHEFVPVILAGGSGTRFWPRSRRAKAKQVLALDGIRTMIQQTLDRLSPLSGPETVWVVTNSLLRETISDQLPRVEAGHILSEPAARNTAPACALAAFLIEKTSPQAVVGIFPSDHVIQNTDRFIAVLRAGIALASSGDRMVVLGVPPTRPETGYGYIEQGSVLDAGTVPCGHIPVRRVVRFTEKPDRQRAEQFLSSGHYAWNSGIFLWMARTLCDSIREYVPAMATLLTRIAATYGTEDFDRVFAEVYPECENISIDYAVLEPRSAKGAMHSEIYCLPADFAWNDLGSWAALHEHQMTQVAFRHATDANIVEAEGTVTIESAGNYVYAPGRTVALVGVQDLVVVQTGDALLITTRARSQDVGKVVRALSEAGREELI